MPQDDRTNYLDLPLPYKDNLLELDVERLRSAFQVVDQFAALVGARIPASAAEVAAGTNAVKYISPLTLAGASINAAQINGVLDVSKVPAAAMQDLVDVENDAARFALTAAVPGVHLGASVRVMKTAGGVSHNPPKLYLIHDMSNLNNEKGYREYAVVVKWENVQDKPIGQSPTAGNLVVYGPEGTVSTSAPVASGDAVDLATLQEAIDGITIPTATTATASADGEAGIVALAKDTDTISRDKAATPAGVAAQVTTSAATGFAASKAANGYCKLPNGICLQWGTLASGNTVTFPIAFENACLHVMTVIKLNTDAAPMSAYFYISSMTKTNFVRGVNAGYGGYWIAIGC
jgi:hypothetical protein